MSVSHTMSGAGAEKSRCTRSSATGGPGVLPDALRPFLVTKKGRKASGKTPGPPVADDLVQRDFSAPAPDMVWLTDITEHPTLEGKLYMASLKDVFSNRIVGY